MATPGEALAAAAAAGPQSYLALSPDSEPMRLDSLCMNCEENVR